MVSNNQDLINDPAPVDKSLDGETFIEIVEVQYTELYGAVPLEKRLTPEQKRLTMAQLAAMAEVISENQDLINAEGIGFKGLIPAVFARLVGGRFIENSAALLVELVLSTVMMAWDLTQNQNRIVQSTPRFHRLELAAGADRDFGEMRCWLTDLSDSLLAISERRANASEDAAADARDAGDESNVDGLEKIMNSGQHLLALVNDTLDLSKIEADKMEIHIERFAIAPLIEDVAATIRPIISKNGNTRVTQINTRSAEGTSV